MAYQNIKMKKHIGRKSARVRRNMAQLLVSLAAVLACKQRCQYLINEEEKAVKAINNG